MATNGGTTNVKKKKGSFRSIFRHADGVDKLFMTLGFLGSLGDGVLLPVVMFVSSRLINNVGNRATIPVQDFQHSIERNVLTLCFVACAQLVVCFVEGYCWTRTAERQASRLRTRYLKAVLRQDVGYVDLNMTSTAELIASVSSDSLVIQEVISEKVPTFLLNTWRLIGVIAIAFAMLWRLAIVGFPFLTLLIVPGMFYGRSLMNIARNMRIEYSKAATIVEQAISSIRTVYSFVGEAKTSSEYSAALEGSVRLGIRQGLGKGLALGTNGIIFAIWAFMSYYGSRMVMYHGAQGGVVYTVTSLVVVGGLSFGGALANLKSFSEASAAGDHIMEIISRVPKIDSENMEGLILQNFSGEMEFRHIQFAYPSRPESIILKDFSLKVPAGRTIALVGGSGSGKSTVIALLQRFYDPLAGEILFDGVNNKKLQLKWLRSQMGLVSQEPALFATSIRENILFGKEDASLEEVVEATKASNAHTFISQLPQGYDTQVGERGVQMSGGQKQRIAIARAIIKAPKILLLDEATSALDAESERVVQEALDKAAAGRSTVIIAHRLSTIRNADLIAVFEHGQVAEIGSHDELIVDENGLYTSLIRLNQTEQPSNPIAEDAATAAGALLQSQSMMRRDRSGSNSQRILQSIMSRIGSIRSSSIRSVSQRRNDSIKRHEEDLAISRDALLPEPELSRPSFRRLLAMNLPEWRHATAGCIGAVIYGAIQPTYSYFMGSQISAYFLPDHSAIKAKTTLNALIFVGLSVTSFSVNLCQYYSFAVMGEMLTKRIRETMVSKMLSFEIAWFDQDDNATGKILSRLAKDANVVRSLVGDRMALLIHAFSSVAVAVALGLIISWRLSSVMIAVQPLLILCFYCRKSLLQTMSKKAIKAQDESSKLAVEAVSNLRTVTAFSSQDKILRMLEQAQEGPRRENIRQSWFAGIGLGASTSFMSCTWALAFWYGGRLIAQGELDPKYLYQIFLILVGTGRVIADALTATSDLERGSKAVMSVFSILDRFSLIEPEDPEGYSPDGITGNVEFRDLHFAYPTRPDVIIFRGFSLKIEPGKSTALIGHSGSGKSTIIGLIERFYDPVRGTVMIDGRDIKSYHLRCLRKQIALVSQEPALFATSVRQNITYGLPRYVDEAEIVSAAKAANAHDFITGLKDGYDTWCGDKGLQLSGGQKQRIAIARAILKDPAILLLDEATSALDSQSEKYVQEALERVMVGRTSVVVAHRLSTIQSCDTIAVLEKGSVVEKGTHSSLLARGKNGVYHSFVSLQTVPSTPSHINAR